MAHVHIPEERRNKRVDPRSTRQHLVGFDESESIYKVWDPTTNRIMRARNVIFDETLFYRGDSTLKSTLNFQMTPELSRQPPVIPEVPRALPSPPVIEDTIEVLTEPSTMSISSPSIPLPSKGNPPIPAIPAIPATIHPQ